MGVPPQLLGIPGDNTYSNYAEAQRAFWRGTVLPLVNRTTRALGSWLSPAFGSVLEVRPDLDSVEALTPEREALWARLDAASFLTEDEKRVAAGYGARGESEAALKYSPDQPRVPAGSSDGGQWTDGGGGGGELANPQREAGLGKILRNLLKKPEVPKIPTLPKVLPQKLPEFLAKRPGVGKITGDLSKRSKAEQRFAEELRDLGHDVELVATSTRRTADFKINGVLHELKTIQFIKNTTSDGISKSVSKQILRGRGQAGDIIVDARQQFGMTKDIAERSIRRAFGADAKRGLKSLTILTKDGPVHIVRSN